MTIPVVPQTQNVIVQARYGASKDVLELAQGVPVLPPGAGEVQVRVAASSINPIDWHMIEGNRRLMTRRHFPYVPLFDLSGTVTAIGPGVTSFGVGDRVYADNEIHGGGGAQYVNVAQDLLALVPTGMSFTEAAAIPLAAQTALTCLDQGGVTTGSRVAVVGASGGVGHFAVQMAHAAGAFVVGVTSARNRNAVLGFGADEVIDRHETDLSKTYGADSFDVVIDTVGGRHQWLLARRVLRPGGRFVTISRDEDGVVTPAAIVRLLSTITARRIRGSGASGIKYVPVFLKASRPLLERVTALVENGRVAPTVARTLPLTLKGIQNGIEESRAGRTVGKLVLER